MSEGKGLKAQIIINEQSWEKASNHDIDFLLAKVGWMSIEEKRILKELFHSVYISQLNEDHQKKLIRVLCSLYHAENQVKIQGKKFSLYTERILKALHIDDYFSVTLGMWNMHICHSQRFGYLAKEFKNKLKDKRLATQFVIRHIVEDIGLFKPVEFIFAEYVLFMATSVVALQHACNLLMLREKGLHQIPEDGLLGDHTYDAIEQCNSFLPDFFSFHDISESLILRTLEHFANEYAVRVEPFIPTLIIKRDLKHLKNVIRKSFKNTSKLSKLLDIFKNHIDIPKYVHQAMIAYRKLL